MHSRGISALRARECMHWRKSARLPPGLAGGKRWGERLLARSAEEARHLDGEAHVALDLELTLHEGGCAVQLSKGDFHVIHCVGHESQLGRFGRVTMA